VQTARDTVERAIATVNSHPTWRARVVYGDTDSVFVLFEGRSRAEAHRLAKEVSETVTAHCPFPVHLEYEKVYHPCFLAAKKRYVGYKFESATETKGVIDCKGMEIIRRDSCPLLQKTMSEAVSLLFTTNNLSTVRNYLSSVFYNVRLNLLPLGDFVFNKEVTVGTYKPGSTPPAAVMVAYREARKDPQSLPLYGQRVPYIVVQSPFDAGLSGVSSASAAKLVDKVMTPKRYLQLLAAGTAPPLCAQYYLTKVLVPSLKRVFDLIGPSHGSNLPVTASLQILPQHTFSKSTENNKAGNISTSDTVNVGVIASSFPGAFGRFPCSFGDIHTRSHSLHLDPLYRTFGTLEGFLPAADVEGWCDAVMATKLPSPLPQSARCDGSLGTAPDSTRPPPPVLTGAAAAAAAAYARATDAAAIEDNTGLSSTANGTEQQGSLSFLVKPRQCYTCGVTFAHNAATHVVRLSTAGNS